MLPQNRRMDLPPRSYLFVPGNRPERFVKALSSGADAVILDLEDAVAPADKPAARDAVGGFIAGTQPAERARLVVRINDEATPWFADDVAMLASSGAAAVMLPKAERPATVATLRAACPALGVVALVESARGVLNAQALAEAEGVVRLAFGTIDFALDLGLSGDPAGLDHAAAVLALASRAAGLPPPIAGVTADIGDDAVLRAEFERARSHGFDAKLCIHPRQVAAVHETLRPSAQALAWAQRVIAAIEGSSGVVQVDGKMVDRPVELRARRVLAQATR